MTNNSRKRKRVRLYIYNPVHFISDIVDEEDCRRLPCGENVSGDSGVIPPSFGFNTYEMSSYDLAEDKEIDMKRELVNCLIEHEDEIIDRLEKDTKEFRKVKRKALSISKSLSVKNENKGGK